jgi:hypothetical protein
LAQQTGACHSYFRPIAYELDDTPGYRYRFREHIEQREQDPKKRHYFMAAELGESLANDIYFTAAILNGVSLLLIWRFGWNRKAEMKIDQT